MKSLVETRRKNKIAELLNERKVQGSQSDPLDHESVGLIMTAVLGPDRTFQEYTEVLGLIRQVYETLPTPVPLLPEKDQEKDSDSDESDSDSDAGEEYLAPMGDLPFFHEPYQSENHLAQSSREEILVGGMPKKQPRKKGRQRRPQRGNGSGQISYSGRQYEKGHTIVRSPTSVFPSEYLTKLVYVANGLITNAGASTAGYRWHTNAAYDVDPVFGSTSTPGFAELAAIYHFYRVVRYRYTVTLMNNEAFAVTAYLLNTNNDLGILGVNAVKESGNPLSQTCVLSPLGYGGQIIKSKSLSISQVVGSQAPETDDNYRALTNAIPADLTWFGIYAFCGPVNAFTVNKGIQYNIRMEMDIRFYGRNMLTT